VLQRATPEPSRDDLQREFDAEKARAKLLSGAGDKDGARQCLERANALAARIQALAGATAPGSIPVAAPVAVAPRPAAAVAAKGSAAHQAAPPAPATRMGMDLIFDPALLEAPLPDFGDVGPEDEEALLALTGGVPTQPAGAPAAPVHVPSRAAAVVAAVSAPARQPRGALLVAPVAPVATRAPMATPPHMAPVTVDSVTADPALLHMSIPDDEPMLDDVELTEEEASAPRPSPRRAASTAATGTVVSSAAPAGVPTL
jgi:hypothetical protein